MIHRLYSIWQAFLIILILSVGSTPVKADTGNFSAALVKAAKKRTYLYIVYDGSYFSIDYPNGDVPSHLGVCTDVVIRSYRALGIDLQKEVHEDIKANFSAYPSKRIWGLTRPDKNIDHRRVPNLQAFFSRKGTSLPVANVKESHRPGDLVTWMLPGNLPHIGIVSDKRSASGQHFEIIHNIGSGPEESDMLFHYPITGHYRYSGSSK